ncbi:NAD(P)H-dependent oxidoreductase [Terrimonas sp. NA20]|uniref:NAD(P)H-dependent oxidoreductase n=1 Tax=Terrimonas ginsenosidimutans TaxID=2908004 RepID=A0ABS9KXZ9_9BACT|nr:NADPH-dependent FMN reductase [Terrimonas ginsenosidimutans]MCG2617209.1 NAD(P)H-dependent oxidoreductase [Terrimonas ginsenosidimutans]
MSSIINIAAISGSLRKGSYNTMLMNSLEDLLPEGMKLTIVKYDDVPMYNADLDLPDATQRPEPVVKLREQLAAAQGIVIVSPEYNYSIPGVIKNAIDWASRGEDSPLLKKPVALMGVTPYTWGTTRMQVAFHPVFEFLNMKPVYKPEITVAQAKDKFDPSGKLIDEATKKLVRKKLEGLKEMIQG